MFAIDPNNININDRVSLVSNAGHDQQAVYMHHILIRDAMITTVLGNLASREVI